MFQRASPASTCRSCQTLGRMNCDDITTLVTTCASRFGDRNLQQFEQIASRISKAGEAEVLQGLLKVFTHGEPAPLGSAAQELAGRLLAALEPKGRLELKSLLRAALPRYELSVEQFPHYLAASCGSSAMLSALEELEHELVSEPERRALQTMKFWVRNLPAGGRENAA